ncbi:MAG: DUF3267 domain-containing protein [Anaerolineae bacterium]
MPHQAIHELPAAYHEVGYYTANDPQILLRLNLLSLLPLFAAYVGMSLWFSFVRSGRGSWDVGSAWVDVIGLVFALFGVLLLHEWLHGIAIAFYGHKARYGAKFATLGRLKIPIMLYATTDNGLFRRYEFMVIALTPLIAITVLSMLAAFILPDRWHFYLTLAAALNAGGAIGDLWMTWVVLRYPVSALVRDEADSIRVYTKMP